MGGGESKTYIKYDIVLMFVFITEKRKPSSKRTEIIKLLILATTKTTNYYCLVI